MTLGQYYALGGPSHSAYLNPQFLTVQLVKFDRDVNITGMRFYNRTGASGQGNAGAVISEPYPQSVLASGPSVEYTAGDNVLHEVELDAPYLLLEGETVSVGLLGSGVSLGYGAFSYPYVDAQSVPAGITCRFLDTYNGVTTSLSSMDSLNYEDTYGLAGGPSFTPVAPLSKTSIFVSGAWKVGATRQILAADGLTWKDISVPKAF